MMIRFPTGSKAEKKCNSLFESSINRKKYKVNAENVHKN